MALCRVLEPSPSGYTVENKTTGKKYYTVDDLIDSQGCLNCSEKVNCKVLQILENKRG